MDQAFKSELRLSEARPCTHLVEAGHVPQVSLPIKIGSPPGGKIRASFDLQTSGANAGERRR